MRLASLTLSQFRLFEHFTLDFEPGVTVLVGRNASGKSTVLDAAAVVLGAWVSGFSAINEDRLIKKEDARVATIQRGGVSTSEARYPVVVSGVVVWPILEPLEEANIDVTRELKSVEGRTTRVGSAVLRRFANRCESELTAETPEDLPLVAYYGTGRLWVQKRETVDAELRSRLGGYHAALESASDHKRFESWMKWREEDRVQRLALASEEGRPLDQVEALDLVAVSAAACSCLEGARRVHYSVAHKELRVDFEGGVTMPFAALSDGQRNLVALAADLAWRATQLNPHLGADAPKQTRGVVLIDELELHLHPRWQQRVLGDLTRAFPALQFIVTTHSPQVMSSAPKGSVRLLDGAQVHRVEHLRGKDANAIIEDVFGEPSRPREFVAKLEELARLIEDNDLTPARALIVELEALWGSDDTALVGARWEIEHKEADAAD